MDPSRYDVFLSYASEDRQDIAAPLTQALITRGLRVWSDERMLNAGAELSHSIAAGLSRCSYGVVILSPAYMSPGKYWPRQELQGLIAREEEEGSLIIPVWHNVGSQDVIAFNPPLAGRKPLVSPAQNIDEISEAILRVVRPRQSPPKQKMPKERQSKVRRTRSPKAKAPRPAPEPVESKVVTPPPAPLARDLTSPRPHPKEKKDLTRGGANKARSAILWSAGTCVLGSLSLAALLFWLVGSTWIASLTEFLRVSESLEPGWWRGTLSGLSLLARLFLALVAPFILFIVTLLFWEGLEPDWRDLLGENDRARRYGDRWEFFWLIAIIALPGALLWRALRTFFPGFLTLDSARRALIADRPGLIPQPALPGEGFWHGLLNLPRAFLVRFPPHAEDVAFWLAYLPAYTLGLAGSVVAVHLLLNGSRYVTKALLLGGRGSLVPNIALALSLIYLLWCLVLLIWALVSAVLG